MGGIGIGDVVNTVVGVAGAAGSMVAAKSQGDYLNQQLEAGNKQRGMVAGIDEYILGGGKVSGLAIPGYQDIFGQVDFAVQEQIRQVQDQAKLAREGLANSIPNGGAKLRALADLAIQEQDAKSKIIREAQTKKRELDIQFTNQAREQAMQRSPGPSQDARMWAVTQDYGNRVNGLKAMGATLGTLADKMQYGQPQKEKPVEYYPKTGQDQSVTQTGVPSAFTWNDPNAVTRKKSTLEDSVDFRLGGR